MFLVLTTLTDQKIKNLLLVLDTLKYYQTTLFVRIFPERPKLSEPVRTIRTCLASRTKPPTFFLARKTLNARNKYGIIWYLRV